MCTEHYIIPQEDVVFYDLFYSELLFGQIRVWQVKESFCEERDSRSHRCQIDNERFYMLKSSEFYAPGPPVLLVPVLSEPDSLMIFYLSIS